jgi:competence protein ComEA
VDQNGGEDVVIDVAGEVARPGVYRLPAGSRVDDAVQRAGGATGAGDVEQINLAARLADGQQIVIPVRAKSPAGVAGGAAAPGSATADGPISLGTATVEELDTIEGIGPVTAQNIVDYRDQHGGVSSVDQLDEIDGIGPATMDALRARLQP